MANPPFLVLIVPETTVFVNLPHGSFWKSEKQVWKVRTTRRSPASPEVRRHEYFAQQSLGAGAIHSPRASAIAEG
jgi:hypothetical protein